MSTVLLLVCSNVLLTLAWSSAAPAPKPLETAVFAGGCFWCMESDLERVPGVESVISGYTGGTKEDPTYHEVSDGGTGHTEAVEVGFDPARVSYKKLLEVFWVNVDPTVNDRQFCDQGRQYRPAVFYRGIRQRAEAEASRAWAASRLKVKAPIVVEIVPASRFYPAEDYHQDYHRKNPLRYKFYRGNCGRNKRLRELWGAP